MTRVTLPTGEPLELRSAGVVARIGTVAAVLRSVTVDGVAITQPIPDGSRPSFCTGIVLAPWPNRVRDGLWTLDGRQQQLDLTEAERHNALHGLLEFADYEVRDRSETSVTLGAVIPPQHGWPFLLDTWVRYELLPDGIAATHGVTNLSDLRAPYGTGAHPFLRVGDVPAAELELTVAAERYLEVDERLNPVELRDVEGTAFDVRDAKRVAQLELDTAYTGVGFGDVVDGRGISAWVAAPDGARTILRQDVDWPWVQAFTTDIYATPDGPISAVAVEPMTAPPNALNSGDDLIWLQPGDEWQGGWDLRYAPA